MVKSYDRLVRTYTGDGRVLDNGVEVYARYPGGYYADGKYYWYVTDYQGNNAGVIGTDGQMVQKTEYYPYGEPWREPEGQPWLYGANERLRMDGVNEYDFNARRYNPVTGNFTTWDKKCEKIPGVSPYIYCGGDPINLSDKNGLFPSKQEALDYSVQNLWGADPFYDEKTEEWYLAMDETGKMKYSGEGEMTRFYGKDSPYNTIPSRNINPVTVANAFSLSSSLKVNLIEEAAVGSLNVQGISAKHSLKTVDKAFGKTVAHYCRIFKVGAFVLDIGYTFSEGKDLLKLYNNNQLTSWNIGRSLINVGFTWVGYAGWPGYTVSLVYFLVDAAYGDKFWESISNGKIYLEKNNY